MKLLKKPTPTINFKALLFLSLILLTPLISANTFGYNFVKQSNQFTWKVEQTNNEMNFNVELSEQEVDVSNLWTRILNLLRLSEKEYANWTAVEICTGELIDKELKVKETPDGFEVQNQTTKEPLYYFYNALPVKDKEDKEIKRLNKEIKQEIKDTIKTGEKYCYYDLIDPKITDYIKYGENSIVITKVYNFSTEAILNQTSANANFAHLEINTSNSPYDGLVGYWSFDGDKANASNVSAPNKAYDLSNLNNDGTYYGDAYSSNASGIYDDALVLDGNEDYVRTSTTLTPTPSINQTYSMWFKTNSWESATAKALFSERSASNTGTILFCLNSTKKLIWDYSKRWTTTIDCPSVNNWHHLIALSNETGRYIYIDGSLAESTSTGTLTASTGLFTIGSDSLLGNQNAYALNGSIDEVMIFNKALTQDEITAIYNNQSKRFKEQGDLTLSQITLNGSGYNQVEMNLSLERELNTNVSASLGYWDNSSGYYSSSEINLTEGLVGYWTGDGNANDYSGNGNDGTFNGNANASVTGVYGNAFVFDGSGDYVSTSTNFTQNWTVSFWKYQYSTPVGSDSGMFNPNDHGGSSQGLYFWIGTTNYLHLLVRNSTGFSINDASVYQFTNNVWQHVTVSYEQNSATGMRVYINGVNVKNISTVGIGTVSYQTTNFIGCRSSSSPQYGFNGLMDEVMIYNDTLSASEIKELYIKGLAKWNYTNYSEINSNTATFNIPTSTTNILPEFKMFANTTQGNQSFYTPYLDSAITTTLYTPETFVVFNSQSPIDLNTTNVIGQDGINITYNITEESNSLNTSTIKLYYKTNSSQTNTMFYLNGTAYEGYFSQSPTDNISSTYRWNFLDNSILSGTYNYGEVTMENTPHSSASLTNQNQYLMIELLNVSSSNKYGFYEIMSNSTNIQRIYYCNSSYSTGNPLVNTNCANIYTIPAGQAYNHQHTIYSSHQVIPFAIDNSQIGGVKVTPTSYFLLRGTTSADVNYYYITNTSRVNAFKLTANAGATWTPQTFTIDSHLHQYGENYSMWYYACANNTQNVQTCSSPRQDLLELGGLPPTAPMVYIPNQDYTYGENIPVEYTESISPNEYSVTYNISILDSEFNLIKNIAQGLNVLSYTITDIFGVDDYYIGVSACDTLGQCSIDYSDIFNITKATANLTLTSNVGWNILASTYATITGINCPSQLTCNLFQAGVSTTNPYTDLFPAGNYAFLFNTSGNQNYTSFSISKNLISSITSEVISNETKYCKDTSFGYNYLDNQRMKSC